MPPGALACLGWRSSRPTAKLVIALAPLRAGSMRAGPGGTGPAHFCLCSSQRRTRRRNECGALEVVEALLSSRWRWALALKGEGRLLWDAVRETCRSTGFKLAPKVTG